MKLAIAPEPLNQRELRDATEVRFSIRVLLIVMAGLAGTVTALSAFIRRFPADVQPRLVVLWGLLAVTLIGLFAYHARRRYVAEQKAGRVLFLLIPHSYFIPRAPDFARLCCGLFLLAVAPALWIAYSFTIAAAPPGQGFFPVEPYMLYGLLGSGAGITCLWWRRVRVTENGIVLRSRFIPWEKCFRWYWDACNKNVAVINCEPRVHLAVIVSVKDRAAIDSLLKNKIVPRRLNGPMRTKS